MQRYKLIMTAEFLAEWRREYRHSKTVWGQTHARQYFHDFRIYLDQTLGRSARALISEANRLGVNAAYFRYKNSHWIVFEINDAEKTITLLDLYGRNRFHEIEKLKARSNNESR